MKKLIFFIIYLFIFHNIKQSYSNASGFDMYIKNNVNHLIGVQLYPVGMCFNGDYIYNLESQYLKRSLGQPNIFEYINGVAIANTTTKSWIWLATTNSEPGFSFQWRAEGSSNGQYGFGLYKLEIQHFLNNTTTSGPDWVDSCLIEFDGYNESQPNGPTGDLHFYIEDDTRQVIFYYRFMPIGDPFIYNPVIINDISSNPDDYTVKCWQPNGPGSEPLRNKFFGPGGPNNYFTYKSEDPNKYHNYDIIPLDSRRDCNNTDILPYYEQNQIYPDPWYDQFWDYKDDERVGELRNNLFIKKNVHTPANNWKNDPVHFPYLAPITVDPGASLKLDNNVSLTLSGITNQQYQDFVMKIKAGANLNFGNNSRIIIQPKNRLVFDCGSIITGPTQSPEAQIQIAGGSFCDKGSYMSGLIRIVVTGGRVPYFDCASCVHPNQIYFKDSTTITVDSSGVFEIPNNTELIFNGVQSKLEVINNSIIIFGSGSKLTLQNGAHIMANNAIFTSTTAGSTWDGIYLSGNINDTIIGCTIQNATNGINVTDKYSSGINQPKTIITDCSFIDSSNSQITSGITVSNSTDVLIKNNSFSSVSVIEGFLNAILVQNCPSGNLDIIDNTINNVTNGITSIQSSPYIARNSINGQTGDGIGIYLDNSNGTVKYNNVQNFQKSYVSYYSSPYLYRNTFNGASSRNIDLYENSAPMMNILFSGSRYLNLGGNNLISGQPSDCGIYINDNSLPAMDNGYNNISVSSSNYLVCNDLNMQTFDVSYNYWTDRPPQYNKFAVNNGTVVDTPDYDGVTLPKPSSYQLNDIGFGLYDSVYYVSGDSPYGNIFEQAYENEISGQYSNAISGYKQVVSDYTNSNLAPAAISRIINCLEKKPGTANDYLDLQSYMGQILGRSSLPHAIKELAEDFIIKTKVNLWRVENQQNEILNAINNYDTMYQHNIGNAKGTHALIDKLSLISIYNDTTQDRNNAYNNSNQKKLSLLSAILGKNYTTMHISAKNNVPKEYMLYQNYPNPFNPVTKIKYDIPKDGFVTIKIFDLIGREIFSTNEYKLPGTYTMSFDGSKYASGVYFYRIEAQGFVAVKKMVLVK